MTRLVLSGVDVARLRRWRGYEIDRPSAAVLSKYARATGDFRRERLSGEIAPPTYAFVPFSRCLFPLLDDLLGRGNRARVIHLGHEFALYEPIQSGGEYALCAELVSFGHGPLGAVVEFGAAVVDDRGRVLNEQMARLLIRDTECADPIDTPTLGSNHPATAPGTSEGSLAVAMGGGLAAAYAAASGDDSPLHVNPAAARRQGFAGAVVHGICTLGMICHAIEQIRPDRWVGALRSSFVRPVYEGDRLDVHFGSAGPDCWFHAANRRRRGVIRDASIAWSLTGPAGPGPAAAGSGARSARRAQG